MASPNTVIWDVDATTNITHTFAADIDFTIMSPAGTVVTLSTDNGAGNDNVFNGTVWDDDADPDGQVPYVTKPRPRYGSPVREPRHRAPLVPEEAMGAFIGENPNGTWTLTVVDDLAGDSGSINSWSLHIADMDEALSENTRTFSTTAPVAIPTGPAVVSSTIAVANADSPLTDVDALTNITHTFAADIDFTIASPAGTIVTLSTDNGAGNDNVFNGTVWDDDADPGGQVPYLTNAGVTTDHPYANNMLASPLVPEEAMAAFIGENPNGTWTLTVSDDAGATTARSTAGRSTSPAATARALPPGSSTLSVVLIGAGSGTVTSTPTGIHCPSDCSETVLTGTNYVLTATPNPGSVFAGWSGGTCSGTGVCSVFVSGTRRSPPGSTSVDLPRRPRRRLPPRPRPGPTT